MSTPKQPEPSVETESLFAVEGESADNLPATIAPAEATSKKKTATKESAPVTAQGDSAKDILGAWIDWYTAANNGVPIPGTIIARVGKQVKGLILSGYTTNDIKYGLAYWTIKHVDTGIPPTQLDTLVWEWASKTRGNHQAWRAHALQAISAFSGGTVNAAQPDRAASRHQKQQTTRDTISQWAHDEGF